VAKIERSFSMNETPERAQEMFLRDIGPDLHRAVDFALEKEESGRLVYQDGLITDPYNKSWGMGRLTGHHIYVSFSAGITGATVTVSGRAEREIRDAVDRLGQPGEWPDTAPHP
jgi:hypothetical protein